MPLIQPLRINGLKKNLSPVEDKAVPIPPQPDPVVRGLKSSVRFFIDRAIALAVLSVARGHAQRTRLSIHTKGGAIYHVWIFRERQQGVDVYVAHSNDMCMFAGSGPSLYVMHENSRDLESAVYLFFSENLKEESSVYAQIFREASEGSKAPLPLLEGSSEEGPASIKEKIGIAGV